MHTCTPTPLHTSAPPTLHAVSRGLKVAVAGIPKTIDNDVSIIDRSFGFDTAVEAAQRNQCLEQSKNP